MERELQALELPAFELDCTDWLVATPEAGLVPEEFDGAPVIAVLSTMVLSSSTNMVPGRAVLRVGLIDEIDDDATLTTEDATRTAELVDVDFAAGSALYVVTAPGGTLGVVAEFHAGDSGDAELMSRFERLMTSFRWAS